MEHSCIYLHQAHYAKKAFETSICVNSQPLDATKPNINFTLVSLATGEKVSLKSTSSC